MRAGYAALAAGLIGGLLAAALLWRPTTPPAATVAAALGLEVPDTTALDTRRLEAVEALTLACMRDHGMAYAPRIEDPAPIPDAEVGPETWAARWGFGVTTMDAAVAQPPVPDPNLVHAAGLEPAERAAYLGALHGGPGVPGCQGRAREMVMDLRTRLLRPIRADLDRLLAAVEHDPATRDATDAWARCMGPTGLTDPVRATAGRRLIDRFGAALGAAHDAAALAALQAEERQIAVLVARCEADYVEARSLAAADHERRFVRRHGLRLAAIGAAIRAAEASLPSLPP